MTPDPPPVPNWQSLAWAEHVTQAVQHFCEGCREYLVPRAGVRCPVCSATANFEDNT